jgi:hypothetical protein
MSEGAGFREATINAHETFVVKSALTGRN